MVITDKKKVLAVGAVCLWLGSSGLGECASSIQENQKEILQQMKENSRNFGHQDRREFESVKRGMNRDSQERQRDIERRKTKMEDGYSASASEYNAAAQIKAPALTDAPQKKDLDTNIGKRPLLKASLEGVESSADSSIVPDKEDVDAGNLGSDIEREEANQQKKSVVSTLKGKRLQQLGLIAGALFVAMAGLVYIGKKRTYK